MKQKTCFTLFIAVLLMQESIAQSESANRQLGNLKPTTINRSLIARSNDSLDLGSSILNWQNLYLTKGVYFSGVKSFFVTNTNTGIGLYALNSNTNGVDNTTVGYNAGFSNSTGNGNTSLGKDALFSNLIGSYNTAIGRTALYSNTVGNNNTAVGINSLRFNTEGDYNTAIGDGTLYSNTTGSYNTANGYLALYANTSGYDNSAYGKQALRLNTTGYQNTAIGEAALYDNTSGYDNTAIGTGALENNTYGDYNTAVGRYAGQGSITANGNSSFGYGAGTFDYEGNYNTALGYDAERSGAYSYSTAIGYQSRASASYQIRLGNSSTSSIGGYENWTNFSDGRFKKNVKENVKGLSFINKLRPVTYSLDIHSINTKMDVKETFEELSTITEREKIIHSGFIAQEVEKVAKELGYDFSGVDAPKNDNDMYGLRYAEFVVPLVKAVQELSAQNDELKKRLEKLEALLLSQSIDASLKNNSTNASSFSVYPNPVKNILLIQSEKRATFSLADATGKVVITKQITGNGSMDVSQLPTGLYFLKNIEESKTCKIIVEK